MRLPRSLNDIISMFDGFDWERIASEVNQETNSRIAIVGPVNSGKSTLFNLLKGKVVSPVAAVPGTTRQMVLENVGPFALLDTPGLGEVGGEATTARIAWEAVESADLVLLLLDASAGVRQSDVDLYRRIRETAKPVIVALNKIDIVKRDLKAVLRDIEFKFNGIPVIPISAKTGQGVADRIMPAIIDAYPGLAVTIGRALPAFRDQAAKKLIRNATLWSGAWGLVPVPALDIPALLVTQIRLVLRLAALYGHSLSGRYAGELITTMAGGLVSRYLGQELAKLVPGFGSGIAAVVAASSTWNIGTIAASYFEGGRKLSPSQMKAMYGGWFRWRKPSLPKPDDPPELTGK
jgi:small GTP-binding protein